ncbi:hypothetical protein BHE74_00007550 [Ensete ventricosum]|nr:hypothetical protein GW17_00003494 [Ensete ventricosum]RWW83923.1 hypothetical protein BHE74_00007550 [Ensete ventricosum]
MRTYLKAITLLKKNRGANFVKDLKKFKVCEAMLTDTQIAHYRAIPLIEVVSAQLSLETKVLVTLPLLLVTLDDEKKKKKKKTRRRIKGHPRAALRRLNRRFNSKRRKRLRRPKEGQEVAKVKWQGDVTKDQKPSFLVLLLCSFLYSSSSELGLALTHHGFHMGRAFMTKKRLGDDPHQQYLRPQTPTLIPTADPRGSRHKPSQNNGPFRCGCVSGWRGYWQEASAEARLRKRSSYLSRITVLPSLRKPWHVRERVAGRQFRGANGRYGVTCRREKLGKAKRPLPPLPRLSWVVINGSEKNS